MRRASLWSYYGLLWLVLNLPGTGAPPLNQIDEADLNLPVVRGVIRVSVNDPSVRDYRGSAVARTSDLDGDGVPDMVVGAYADDTTAADAGAIYIFYLQQNANRPIKSYSKITSGRGGFTTRLQASDYFGVSVAGLPDVDGDGVGDVVVGALGDDDVGLNAGAVYLLYMSHNTVNPVVSSVKITSGKAGFDAQLGQNSYFGSAVGVLHDLDGNGVVDLAVGAYGEDKLAGVVYILFLQRSATTPVMGYWKLRSKADNFPFSLFPGNAFGVAITSIGDINGDGVPEMAVGAYMDGEYKSQAGAVYVILLRKVTSPVGLSKDSPVLDAVKVAPGLAGFNDTTLAEKAYFGASVAGFTDLDNDGIPELVVGTIGDNQANLNAGALHMLYMGYNDTNMLPYVRRWRKITTNSGEGFNVPLQPNQNFGAAVAELPDLDGDNVTELVVGSYVATNASTFVLYKNLLAPVTESPPKIYGVTPTVLKTSGGELVTVYAAVDLTNVNMTEAFTVEVMLGTTTCNDPDMTPYKGNAFPGFIASNKQHPFVITCTSSLGVGGNLLAQAIITQRGAEITLSMHRAISYQAPSVIAITAQGSQAKGGFNVQVVGSSFGVEDFRPTVFVHGTPCNSSTWVSDTMIICSGAPAGLGQAAVQVSVGGQISTSTGLASLAYDGPLLTGWRVKEPQAVSEPIEGTDVVSAYYFSPYTAGEELLQIFGSNFGPTDNEVEVLIGHMPCTKAKIISDREINCLTPAGKGSLLTISVNIALLYKATLPANFSYGIPLVVTVVPEIANVEGGDMVIMGRNFGSFSDAPVVMIGDQLCRDVKIIFEHELLTCKYPAGTGKELMLTVEVGGQRNDPPRVYSYADIFGQRTVEVDFLLAGETVDSFTDDKQHRFQTILQSILDQDPTVAVVDDGVNIQHVKNVAPQASSLAGVPAVQIRTDVATQNAKVAETVGLWLRTPEHIMTFQNYLKTATVNALGLFVLSTNVSEVIYCPPGQQAQEIAPKEFTCVPCAVGFYQPIRSKAACRVCPTGAQCNNTGIQMPIVMPGFWRKLGGPDVVKVDPYFENFRIYECNPNDICLGGLYSNCSAGHIQGSPLCAVCEHGHYMVNGYCTACGNKRSIQVTLYLILALALLAFFALLYAFVRPGNDIDEATDSIKDQVADGPSGKAFNPSVTMRSFLSNTLTRHLSSKLTRLTHVPDLWSKAKISITFLQIMASLNVAYTIPWPRTFQRLLEKINVINLNVLRMPGLAYSCVAEVNYFNEFQVALIFPFVLTVFFLIVHHLGTGIIHRKVEANKLVINALEQQVSDLRAQLVRKMRAIGISMRMRQVRRNSMNKQASADESLKQQQQQQQQQAVRVADAAGGQHVPSSGQAPSTGSNRILPATAASQSSLPLPLPRPNSPPVPRMDPSPPERGQARQTGGSSTNNNNNSLSLPQLPEEAAMLPSPSVPSTAIDIFSPFHPRQQQTATMAGREELKEQTDEDDEAAGINVTLDILATPHSDRSQDTTDTGLSSVVFSTTSGDSPALPLNHTDSSSSSSSSSMQAGGSQSSSDTKVIKRATFSLATDEGDGSKSDLRQLSDGVDGGGSLVTRNHSSLSSAQGGGSSSITGEIMSGLATIAQDNDEEESIVELKHKVAILEKQQNFEKFSMESFTSRLLTFWFWIILLIYPSVSRVTLEAVNCRTLDAGRRYLVSDFTIDCDSHTYKMYLPAVVLALCLYPVGIPVMFFLLLKFRRNTHPWDDNLSFLYKAYKPTYWWFEVYELVRKLFLTGLIIFVAAGTATQIAIACVVCVVSMALHLRLQPYEDRWDDLLQTCSLAELLVMTYCALLLKLDLTGADSVSLRVFDYLLIISNGFVLCLIMPTSFYVQSKQYIERFLRPSEQTLTTLMKREFLCRGAAASSLLLAIWACMATSGQDDLNKPIIVLSAVILVNDFFVSIYFLPFLQARLPVRYRIIPSLDPSNFALEADNNAAVRLGALRVSNTARQAVNLSKLNTRKLEAMKAAGLIRQGSSTLHRGDSLGDRQQSGPGRGMPQSSGMRRQSSGAEATPGGLLASGHSSGRLVDQRLGFGHSASRDEENLAPRNLPSLWVWLVKMRRLVDPFFSVLMLDLAVMCADSGHGTTNAARMVMLGVASIFTAVICVYPQVQDGFPPRVSPLRVAQCAFSISTIHFLILSMHRQARDPVLIQQGGDKFTGPLIATSVAILVSALCGLHSSVGIIHRLMSKSRDRTRRAFSQDGVTTTSSSGDRRADSVYGATGSQWVFRDFLLLSFILVAALGLGLTRPKAGSPAPIVMVVGLGLLFAYKPMRALRETNDNFMTQVALLHMLIVGLRKQKPGKGKKDGEVDDVFDERDLSRTASPEVLAAEVIRLRRKIAELEDRVEADEVFRRGTSMGTNVSAP